jgi:hypothetical protein
MPSFIKGWTTNALQEESITAVVVEVTDIMCHKGNGSYSQESASAVLGLLTALADSSGHGGDQYASVVRLQSLACSSSAAVALEPSATASGVRAQIAGLERAPSATRGSGSAAGGSAADVEGARPENAGKDRADVEDKLAARLAKSYAAGAVVQAALNAMMAAGGAAEPLGAFPPAVAPASSAAAAVAVQVGKRLWQIWPLTEEDRNTGLIMVCSAHSGFRSRLQTTVQDASCSVGTSD